MNTWDEARWLADNEAREAMKMTYQEILEGITRHRANPVLRTVVSNDLARKIDEIEWALQALAEKLRDSDFKEGLTEGFKKET